jgi:hypothetical protein
MLVAYVLLLVIPLALGVTELAMRGLPFFLFRNAGAQAGNSQDLNEDQGPGQIHDVKAPHTAKPSTPATPAPTPSKTN